MRIVIGLLLWIWGLGGLVNFTMEKQMQHPANVDSELIWIGGILLFGLGALIAPGKATSPSAYLDPKEEARHRQRDAIVLVAVVAVIIVIGIALAMMSH